MEFKQPKPKKSSISKLKKISLSKNEKVIMGVFNGQFVTVHDLDSMNYLYETGSFGKGTLSKGQPIYHIIEDDISKVMVQHQFENHSKWNAPPSSSYSQKNSGFYLNDFKLSLQSVSDFLESSFNDGVEQETWKSWKEIQKQKAESFNSRVNWPEESMEFKPDTSDQKDEIFSSLVNEILESRQIKQPNYNKVSSSEEVIVINTSFDPHSTDLPINASAVLKKLPFAPQENLNLNLEESFFLKHVLGCLNIVDLNFSEIGIPDLWEKFNSIDKNFTERYIAYSYYRNKGWVVRSGLKFGGDYLLYKDGPSFYHASYLVKILDRRSELTWSKFIAMNRLTETFNKDLLLCNVLPDETLVDKHKYPYESSSHLVEEFLIRRWFPSKERCTQESTSS